MNRIKFVSLIHRFIVWLINLLSFAAWCFRNSNVCFKDHSKINASVCIGCLSDKAHLRHHFGLRQLVTASLSKVSNNTVSAYIFSMCGPSEVPVGIKLLFMIFSRLNDNWLIGNIIGRFIDWKPLVAALFLSNKKWIAYKKKDKPKS